MLTGGPRAGIVRCWSSFQVSIPNDPVSTKLCVPNIFLGRRVNVAGLSRQCHGTKSVSRQCHDTVHGSPKVCQHSAIECAMMVPRQRHGMCHDTVCGTQSVSRQCHGSPKVCQDSANGAKTVSWHGAKTLTAMTRSGAPNGAKTRCLAPKVCQDLMTRSMAAQRCQDTVFGTQSVPRQCHGTASWPAKLVVGHHLWATSLYNFFSNT